LQLELVERTNGFLIRSVASVGNVVQSGDVTAFARCSQGMELLLTLLHDSDPSPEVFDAAVAFLGRCAGPCDPVLAFSLQFLAQLGLLPLSDDDTRFRALGSTSKDYVRACADAVAWAAAADMDAAQDVARFCSAIINDHLSSPLKAKEAARLLTASAVPAAARQHHREARLR
jgi:hypothetical protein